MPTKRGVVGVGLRRVLRRPRLVVLVWLVSLALASISSWPMLSGLHGALDERPLARALAEGRADAAFAELAFSHPLLPRVVVGSLALAGLLAWGLNTVLLGGLIQALRRPGDRRRALGPEVLAQAARHARELLVLGLHGLLLRLPIVILAGLLLAGLSKGSSGKPYPRALAAGGVGLLLVLFLWSAVSVILHHAQVYRMGASRLTRFAALQSLRLGLRHGLRVDLGGTVRLALFSMVSLILLVVLGRMLTQGLDERLLWGLGFLVRQICALLRATVGLAVLAGAVESVDAR